MWLFGMNTWLKISALSSNLKQYYDYYYCYLQRKGSQTTYNNIHLSTVAFWHIQQTWSNISGTPGFLALWTCESSYASFDVTNI